MDGHTVEQASLPLDANTRTAHCVRCGQDKSLGEMGWDRATGQLTDHCKKCRRSVRKHLSYANPANRDTWRNRHLTQTYGITVEAYKVMLVAQGGVCAICQQPSTRIGGRYGKTPLSLVVDHDHVTRQVRALLCHPCNQGIGLMQESSTLLRQAAAYLEAHGVHS